MRNRTILAAALVCVAAAAVGATADASVTLGLDGRVTIASGGQDLVAFRPLMADEAWRFTPGRAVSLRQDGEARRFTIEGGGGRVAGEATVTMAEDGVLARWAFTGESAAKHNCLVLSADVAVAALIGGTWTADGGSGAFPADLGDMHLFTGETRRLALRTADGREIDLHFATPTPVVIQDDRKWGPTFTIRIGRGAGELKTGEHYEIAMTVATPAGASVARDGIVVITASDEWIPLATEIDIEAGSALDLTRVAGLDGPCGTKGRVIATPDGHFAFEQDATPRRFYGVNLCFDAQYLAHERADRLLDRLVRLGYDSIRIHHYEAALTDGKPGFAWNPEKVDRLDYLLAGCRARGIHVTTDLYVSRPVSAQQVAMPGDKDWAYRFKILPAVHEPAFQDWVAFTRQLLDHVNPHTGVRLGDDPTLAWLALINEGNIGNYWVDVVAAPQWTVAWNRWLAARYGDHAALTASWGAQLRPDEDLAAATVALPGELSGDSPRHRDCTVFVAETERAMAERMTRVLRDDLQCAALITNLNAWTNHAPNQLARGALDYVDDHFYVDHPEFIEGEWRLPSRCGNRNPVREGAPGGRGSAALRLWGKPFAISEFNYSAPGRFRGVGGILTGALAAVQDWDAIWRFAYSHSDEAMFTPSPLGYFDLVSDPLNQAADRAALMLFRRGDLPPAAARVALVMTGAELRSPPNRTPNMGEAPGWLAWLVRLGSVVVDDPARTPPDAFALPLGWSTPVTTGLTAFGGDRDAILAALRARGAIGSGGATDPSRGVFATGGGALLIDAPNGILRFDTPRTAGGYAEPGQRLDCARAGFVADGFTIGATVFATAVDDQPLAASRRILVTHLTDLQNTGATFAETARQTLLDWGRLPHLVRAGAVDVRLKLAEPAAYRVHALATSGRRVAVIPARVVDGALVFTCSVAGAEGARMLYEVVRE